MEVIGKSPRKQVEGLSERMSAQETNSARLIVGINQRFQGVDARLLDLENRLSALAEILGEEEAIKDLVAAKNTAKLKAEAEAEKASLDEGVRDGYVIPTNKIDERSLVVGIFTDKDGIVQEPGRSQLVMPPMAPQFKNQMLNQEAGFSIDLPNGTKFTVTEIYSVDDKKYVELKEERQRAAAEAVSKAKAAAEATAAEAAAASEKNDVTPPTTGAVRDTGEASAEVAGVASEQP